VDRAAAIRARGFFICSNQSPGYRPREQGLGVAAAIDVAAAAVAATRLRSAV